MKYLILALFLLINSNNVNHINKKIVKIHPIDTCLKYFKQPESYVYAVDGKWHHNPVGKVCVLYKNYSKK